MQIFWLTRSFTYIEAACVWQENIVLGHAVDAAWYAKVLSACHLDSDLQQLPEGDMTQLSDRGSNMSGDNTSYTWLLLQVSHVALKNTCQS